MPSNLLCPKSASTFEAEPQNSVNRETFDAIKYLAIYKGSNGIMAVVEIGWRSLGQA